MAAISNPPAESYSTDESDFAEQNKVTYTDPNADVSLQSTEGRIFKVESYVLKATW